MRHAQTPNDPLNLSRLLSVNTPFPISQSKAAFDLALDRSRSTPVQLIPG